MASTLLTPTEVAEQLRVSTRTLEFWRHQGRGPAFVRLGKRVRYRPDDLEQFIAEQRTAPA